MVKKSNTETTMTVRQIMNLGLWSNVCEYKDWDEWILSDGKIDEDELVTFDTEFKKELMVENETHKLATVLHSKLCISSHNTQCSWYYVDHWDSPTRQLYIKKAKKLMRTNVVVDDIISIIEAL